MKGSDILTMFQELTDDEQLDETTAYNIMDVAKNRVEDMRAWEFLKGEDSSLTWSPSDTFETAKALPSDFRAPIAREGQAMLFVGDDRLPYWLIPIEMKRRLKNSPRRWFIDWANTNFFLMGTTSETKTIYLPYVKTTTAMAAGITPVWPTRFHPLMAFKMAEIFQGGIDGDEVSFRMSGTQRFAMREMLSDMVNWDDNTKLPALEGEHVRTDVDSYPDVADLNN